ncbi:hypothetical protein CcaverHIS002_0309460 [Cutaneotrichosporon cavernicola]|nr:hypothetical protein CcaverHIS002_0309460 [Cutaneotrichosporon cavernicola]BEJ06409.1 hypothetical protein CcaverHIS641_0309310 [Cutaneotrichosporon cavernicola]
MSLSPRLSHRVDSALAATPTAAESDLVIGVRVTRAIQGYFKRLLAAIREGGEFDELWSLDSPGAHVPVLPLDVGVSSPRGATSP